MVNIRKTRFEKEIDEVLNKLSEMSQLASQAIEKAIGSLVIHDKKLAEEVIEGDKAVDALYKDIEQSSFRILLLDQPVANDFRKVASGLKMITDLERIGDYAVDIADEVIAFPNEPYIKELVDLPLMGQCVIAMVKKAVGSFLNSDVISARELETDDDKVDAYYLKIRKDLIDLIRADEKNAEQSIIFMVIAKYLERIGDHAVNVGEWVDYSSTGTHQIS